MNQRVALLAFILTYPLITNAVEVPMIGSSKAQFHQICGKGIDVEISQIDDHTTMLGLKNNQTNNLDLFISQEQSPTETTFSKFRPVKLDPLSKRFIPLATQDIDILWGSMTNENKNESIKVAYTLNLGPKLYTCGSLQKWPSEKANILYGEED